MDTEGNGERDQDDAGADRLSAIAARLHSSGVYEGRRDDAREAFLAAASAAGVQPTDEQADDAADALSSGTVPVFVNDIDQNASEG